MLHHAVKAAEAGAAVLVHHFGKLTQVRDKEYAGDLVTEADGESEAAITTYLKQHYPTHGILAEESHGGFVSTEEYLWVIDPLDGTTNYAHGYPVAAVSIALLQNGKPIVGVVYNPFSSELFTASLGEGAFLNGKKLHVSTVEDLSKSLLATGFPYDRRTNPVNNYVPFCNLTALSHGVRRAGAASLDLAYVAAGRLEGYWERGIKAWDIAAGSLLVTEAGGTVSDITLQPLNLYEGRILATNGHLHLTLHRALVEIHQ